MAPANEYLTESVAADLAAYNNRLVKKTTIEFVGEAPEVHRDFNRPAEHEAFAVFLGQYAEPDFVDGKVTLSGAAQQIYGIGDDDHRVVTKPNGEPIRLHEYLIGRLRGALRGLDFNRKHAVNGLVYVVGDDGTIHRDGRSAYAQRVYDVAHEDAANRIRKTNAVQHRKDERALSKALKLDPDNKTALQNHAKERRQELLEEVQTPWSGNE